MDPLSHGIIGLAAFSLKHPPALSNPACLGAVIGAIAPDFDIIARVKGDYVYLNHHRVETHSIPGVLVLSTLITFGLSFLFKELAFGQVFIWTLIGGLSHIIFDIFNSYGASILYPLTRKKYSLNLLMIYDPVFTILCLYVILFARRTVYEYLLLAFISLLYLYSRRIDRERLKEAVLGYYPYRSAIKHVAVMPSDFNPLKWDFIVDTHKHYIVGEIYSISGKMNFFKKLKKIHSTAITRFLELSLEDQLGIYFRDFTPIFHIDIVRESERIIVKMTDLRYKIKSGFKHHASFYFDNEAELICSFFHPFKLENKIEVYSRESVN